MVSKVLSVGLMLCVIGLTTQSAHAQMWGYHGWGYQPWGYSYGGCSSRYSAPAWGGWQQPMSYQPVPSQAAPPVATGQTAQPNGQTAQFDNQTYQSFSAEPPAANSYGSAATYPVQSYPAYGGYYGGYASPYYGGSGYGDWRALDNAHYHGVNPNAYP
jgi:hypothetical protein